MARTDEQTADHAKHGAKNATTPATQEGKMTADDYRDN